MRDRMPEEPVQLDADAYERWAAMDLKPNKAGAIIRMIVIAGCLVIAGGAIALTGGNKQQAVQPASQQFAAADPKQVEPQQLTPKPEAPAPKQMAAAEKPKPTPRAAVKPAPVAPPAAIPTPAVTPPPAQAIPEVAPAPSEIAPDAAAAPAASTP